MLTDNLFENVQADDDRTTMMSVTVPSNAVKGESAAITVVATSQADNTVGASDTCIAIAAVKVAPSGSPVPIPVMVGIAIGVGALIVIILLLLKRGSDLASMS